MGNIFTFHGSDRKAGVTMTALTVCEELCRIHPEKTLFFMCLNSRSGAEYFSDEVCSFNDLKIYIGSRTLTVEEVKMRCRYKENFYVMTGVDDPVTGREFFPEESEYLLKLIKDEFDFVVCDAGSELDDGIALGALQNSSARYLVISQCESGIRAYEKNEWLYEKLGLTFEKIIINRYFSTDPYDVGYFAERIGRTKDIFHIVQTAGYCRQAEMDHKSLLGYRNENYRMDISDLAEYISRQAGYRESLERKRRLWRIGSI